MIPAPHGGALVERPRQKCLSSEDAARLEGVPRIRVGQPRLMEALNIARGAFSPLTGFLGREDIASLTDAPALADKTPWGLPVLLDVDAETGKELSTGATALITHSRGEGCVEVMVKDVWEWDARTTAGGIFGATSDEHPGVARYMGMEPLLVEAEVVATYGVAAPFPDTSLSPKQTRTLLDGRGITSVAGFQTRNAPHRGHEKLHKMAAALVDAVMIQPVLGTKKAGDFTDGAIVAAYKAALAEYYVAHSTLFVTLPLEMHYAGPREAIHHALIRKNFGCTHFIVGRDHAGVGNFYAPDAAIKVFETLPDIGIHILTFYGDFFYCTRCDDVESDLTCPHGNQNHVPFSGTTLRSVLTDNTEVDARLMRPEVVTALRRVSPMFVE